MEAEKRLLADCQEALVHGGFDAAHFAARDQSEIGAASVRLAQALLAEPSGAQLHPLGFWRVPLTEWRLGQPRVALHVWDGGVEPTFAEDVHDHCYDFVSVGIVGALEHRMFKVEDKISVGEPMQLMNYAAGSCHYAEEISKSVGALITETGRRVAKAPCLFSLKSNELHSARPLTEIVITVQFQSPCKKDVARVFRSGVEKRTESTVGGEADLTRLMSVLARAF